MTGLNSILLIGALLAFFASFTSFVLIRKRDFVTAGAPELAQQPAA